MSLVFGLAEADTVYSGSGFLYNWTVTMRGLYVLLKACENIKQLGIPCQARSRLPDVLTYLS